VSAAGALLLGGLLTACGTGASTFLAECRQEAVANTTIAGQPTYVDRCMQSHGFAYLPHHPACSRAAEAAAPRSGIAQSRRERLSPPIPPAEALSILQEVRVVACYIPVTAHTGAGNPPGATRQ
jgi:hypothetical protein